MVLWLKERDWLVLFLNRVSHVLTADQSPDLHLQKEGKLNNLLLPSLNQSSMASAEFVAYCLISNL